MLIYTKAGGHGKRANVVSDPAILGSDEIGQAVMRLTFGLAALLAQMVQHSQCFGAFIVGKNPNVIIAGRGGRKKPYYRARFEPLLSNYRIKHGPGVTV